MDRDDDREKPHSGGAPWLAPAAIMLLGLALRLFRLGADSIWYDEGVSLYLANLSIPALIAHTAGDIHPPLYYAALHLWLAAAGHSQFAAAFFSLFCGILLIPATFVTAQRLLGRNVAVLAALLVALSPYHLWYSQEMRMYTLGALLALLSFYFLLRALWPAGPPYPPILGEMAEDVECDESSRHAAGVALSSATPSVVVRPPYPPILGEMAEDVECDESSRHAAGVALSSATLSVVVRPPYPPILGGMAGDGERDGARSHATSAQHRDRPLLSWLGYIVCAALGLYTLYYFAFVLAFEALAAFALWLKARRGKRQAECLTYTSSGKRRAECLTYSNGGQRQAECLTDTNSAGLARTWLAAQIAVLVLYLPWLGVAVRQATQPPVPPWRGFTGLGALAVESWSALSLGQSVEPGAVMLVLLLFALVYLVALAAKDSARAATLLLAGYTFAPLAMIYVASLWMPLYHVRYVFLFAPAFAIVLARGIEIIRCRSALVSALALAVLVLAGLRSAQAYFSDPAYAPDDHRSAVRLIAEQARPGDAVLIDAGYAYPTFVYYYPEEIAWRGRLVDYVRRDKPVGVGIVVLKTGSIGGSPTLGWGSATSDFYATSEAETAAALDEAARRHGRLWLVRIYDTVTDPQGFIRRYLDEHFLMLDDVAFGGPSSLRVQLYRTYRTPRSTLPAGIAGMAANLGNQMNLAGYDVSGDFYPAETTFVTTYWQATAQRPDLRAFVSLVDQAGREWAHWDDVPGGRLYPTSRWAAQAVVPQMWRLTIPAGTPPGQYRLETGLYGSSGSRLDVYDSGGRNTGTTVRLGDVEVGKAQRAVDTTTLPVQQRVNAVLGGEARLLGYSLSSRLAEPGEGIEITAFWQGVRPAAGERIAFAQLLDDKGKLWAATEVPMAAAWDAGEVRREQYRLLAPAAAPDGEMRLIIGIYRAEDKQRLAVQTGLLARPRDSVELGKVRVAGRVHSFAIPAMPQRVDARLGAEALLLGYDRSPSVRPLSLAVGESLRLTLYWQGGAATDVSYTVFVQLLGPDNRPGGQHDAVPGGGLFPTTSWVRDEVVTDVHDVTVRPDAAAGVYRLVAGLYDAASGARLPVTINGVRQPDDMIVLETLTVK